MRLTCPVRLTRLVLPLLLLTALPIAHAAKPAADHWVGTWATAPVAKENKSGEIGEEITLRQIVHVSLGGSQLRVVFTNELGTEPLKIEAASVALPVNNTSSEIRPGTEHTLTFSGNSSISIPPGAVMVSDPVAMTLPGLSDLAISAVLPPQPLKINTEHTYADCSNFEAAGNQVTATTLSAPHEYFEWRFLKSVDVVAPANAAAVVAFGDSITDGAYATRNANTRWPDVLAERFAKDKATRELSVLNTGIGGNRVLHDGTGPSALARFDRDVIDQAGVRAVILLESINDIGHAYDTHHTYDVVTAQDLITGLSQLARRAHTHGIKVYGATLTPYMGAGYSSEAGEAVREAVNHWIRTSNELDGVIDFDNAVKDPARPLMYLPAYDHGDHLHPGDAGYHAMGDSIDLKLFR